MSWTIFGESRATSKNDCVISVGDKCGSGEPTWKGSRCGRKKGFWLIILHQIALDPVWRGSVSHPLINHLLSKVPTCLDARKKSRRFSTSQLFKGKSLCTLELSVQNTSEAPISLRKFRRRKTCLAFFLPKLIAPFPSTISCLTIAQVLFSVGSLPSGASPKIAAGWKSHVELGSPAKRNVTRAIIGWSDGARLCLKEHPSEGELIQKPCNCPKLLMYSYLVLAL